MQMLEACQTFRSSHLKQSLLLVQLFTIHRPEVDVVLAARHNAALQVGVELARKYRVLRALGGTRERSEIVSTSLPGVTINP